MNIQEILAIAQLMALLLPLIAQAVQFIESTVKQAMSSGTIVAPPTGADKQAAALAFFTQLWTPLSTTGTGSKLTSQITPEQFTNLAKSLIDGVVATFNSLDIFKKSTPPIV